MVCFLTINMCLVLNFSKYIFVPILTEWLSGKELILFHLSLTKSDIGFFQTIVESHKKIFQEKVFSAFGLSSFSHHILRWVRALHFDLDEFKLIIDPKNNQKDFLAITSEIVHNDRSLKKKFDCMSVIKRLEVKEVNNSKESNVVSRLFQCFNNVKELTVPCCAVYDRIAFHCRNLTHIDVTDVNKYLHKFNEVFRMCKRLYHFGLYVDILPVWRRRKSKPVDNSSKIQPFLFALIVHAESLRSLTLVGLKFSKQNTILNVMRTRRRLTNFCLAENASVSSADMPNFLRYNGQDLQHLRLVYYRLAVIRMHIHKMCPNLTSLDLPYCVGDSMCTAILSTLKRLKCFKCKAHFTASTIPAFAACRTLETLALRCSWSAEDLQGVHFQWDNLVELSILCDVVSSLLDSCSQLKRLSLFGVCVKVTCLMTSVELLDVLDSDSYPLDDSVVSTFPALKELYCGARHTSPMSVVLGASVRVFNRKPRPLINQFIHGY